MSQYDVAVAIFVPQSVVCEARTLAAYVPGGPGMFDVEITHGWFISSGVVRAAIARYFPLDLVSSPDDGSMTIARVLPGDAAGLYDAIPGCQMSAGDIADVFLAAICVTPGQVAEVCKYLENQPPA